MSRYIFLFIFLFSIFTGSGLYGIGPNDSESVRFKIYEQDTLKESQILYNGILWRNRYYKIRENQFLFSKEFLSGSLSINGQSFKNLNIRYDIYNDEIMIPTNHGAILQLNKEMVDSFTINFDNKTYKFTKIQEDSVRGFNGYVNVLYKGKNALYVKYKKEIELLAVERNKPGNVIISGYITNRDTKEPVVGVTVFIQKLSTGTISNEYGFYTLTLPRGIHLLQFSFIGMKGKMINLNLNGTGEMNMEMNSMLIPLKETVVSAQKNMTLQRFEVGAEKINITSFRLLPTSMGESDIIKSVLLIPGVQSVGEGSAGFNVRGGSADQNLILLYGAPVYNSSHFFGFFSAVNSDIIKDVTLYKGGIPSRYGGRISSVLDITSKSSR